MPDPDDDLDYWLATQALPKEEPAQPGAWQRAAQMLSSQQRPADPMPTRPNGMSWAAALAAIASKDPGGVLSADAQSRRADMDAWYKRNGPDAQFDRQRSLAGELMQEDAAKRSAEGADWTRQHTQDRDMTSDEHWTAEQKRAAQQFEATQTGLGTRNKEDNDAAYARAVKVAEIGAGARAEHEKALADARGETTKAKEEAAKAKAEGQLQHEYNDFRNGKHAQLFDLAQKIKGIEDVWARNPADDKPGAGVFDGSDSSWLHPWGAGRSEDDMAVRDNFHGLQEFMQNKFTGASAPNKQADRIAGIAGAKSGATEKEASVALGIASRDMKEQLRGLGSGREAAARKVLRDMGLDKWVYGDDPTPDQAAAEQLQLQAPPSPAAPPPPAAPGSGAQLKSIQDQATATGKLSDLGRRDDAPPLPQDAVDGPKPRNIIKPDGSRVVYPLTDERFNQLMSKPGWSSF